MVQMLDRLLSGLNFYNNSMAVGEVSDVIESNVDIPEQSFDKISNPTNSSLV